MGRARTHSSVSADLDSLAERALQAAISAGAGDAEAYAVEDAGREVRVHGAQVESLTSATERGVGVRTWIGASVGYAYGTDLSDAGLVAVSARAAGAARIADPDEHAGPPRPGAGSSPIDGLLDPDLSSWSTARLVDLALAIERVALGSDERIAGVEQVVYADSAERVAIRSSTGVAASYEASSCYAYLQALASSEAGVETGLGFGIARGPAGLDPDAIGAEASARAVSMIGAGKPQSRVCPVVFEQTVAASFAGLIGGGLGADTVQRGRSPFADRLGEEIASPAFVLGDDGLDPDGLASAPVDGEGVPRHPTALIGDGRLQTYLHDTYTARRGATESTGNAGRAGYRSQPTVAASNLIVGEGSDSLEKLLAAAGDGILVTDVAGLHSGVNPVSGVFSVGASGLTISGGAAAEPVREFTIASDLVSMLRSVQATGSETRWVPFGGSVRTPPLLVGEMTVSGA